MTDEQIEARLACVEQAVVDLVTIQGPYVESIPVVGEPSTEVTRAAHARLRKAARDLLARPYDTP